MKKFPHNFKYTDFHIGDLIMDAHLGIKWRVIEEIPDGVLLEQQTPLGNGPKIRATKATCKMSFFPIKDEEKI